MIETNNFLIQKHTTSHPHFDLYLKIGDQLKSWIVPNGIPENTKEKKIAVEVINLENDVPESELEVKDNYGQGPLELWDNGKFELEINKDIKIILKPNGKFFNGKYILHIPNWGKWTSKKLWTIEKIS